MSINLPFLSTRTKILSRGVKDPIIKKMLLLLNRDPSQEISLLKRKSKEEREQTKKKSLG